MPLPALPLPALIVASTVLAQAPLHQPEERLNDLRNRSVVVRSIDPEDDDDFSDLLPLKDLIGESRLVVLGEQSHGDGAVFLAKARLIKFLHQEMGFDVLTWESGMFECREVDRALRDPAVPLDEVAEMGIFPIWTFSAQVRPTLEYVRSTHAGERPIETAGFDHQFSGGDLEKRAAAWIAFFDNADPTLLPQAMRDDIVNGFAAMKQRNAANRPDAESIEPYIQKWKSVCEFMDAQRKALENAHGRAEFEFMRRCADDAVVSLRSMLQFLKNENQLKVTDNNVRDERMASNLIWQVNERYKGRKVIAWMATMHAVHDVQNIVFGENADFYKGVVNCGTVAHKALGETMYTIGFTSFDGKACNVWARTPPHELAVPSEGSLEDVCSRLERPFLFIDFRSLPADHWLRQPTISRPLGYGEMTAHWPKQVDAMFYIRTMFPSTRENMLPRYAVIRDPDA